MGKLKLDLDAIEVESFETELVEGSGTVRGQETGVLEPSCAACTQYSDDETCAGGAGDQPTLLTCGGSTCPKTGCWTCGNSCGCTFSCAPCDTRPTDCQMCM
jgi:hypothetical protein